MSDTDAHTVLTNHSPFVSAVSSLEDTQEGLLYPTYCAHYVEVVQCCKELMHPGFSVETNPSFCKPVHIRANLTALAADL